MPKRYFPIAVLTGVMAAIALFGYMGPTSSEALPTRILLDNAGGKVVFGHKTHVDDYGVSCETCHHEAAPGDEAPLSCGQCHGVQVTDQWVEEHTSMYSTDLQCATCHHVEFEKDYDWGHDMHVDNYLAECTDCHHGEDIEPEPTNCADCHGDEGDADMPALRDAVHKRCADCHQDMFDSMYDGCQNCHGLIPQKEALANGEMASSFTKCTSCHTDKDRASVIPSRMTALHDSCMGCHEEIGSGPYAKDQCNQCHFQ